MAARGSRQRQKLLLLHCHSLGEGGDFHKILKILSEMPLANYMFSCHKKLKMRWVSPVTMSERSSGVFPGTVPLTARHLEAGRGAGDELEPAGPTR